MVSEEVICEGLCDDVVPVEETKDVVVGDVVGEWEDPEPHVGVANAHQEKWCSSCSYSKFGVSADDGDEVEVREYLPWWLEVDRVAAFLLGLSFAILWIMMVWVV